MGTLKYGQLGGSSDDKRKRLADGDQADMVARAA